VYNYSRSPYTTRGPPTTKTTLTSIHNSARTQRHVRSNWTTGARGQNFKRRCISCGSVNKRTKPRRTQLAPSR